MTRQQKHDYIFSEVPEGLETSRWDWIECSLLGDIRTLLDGVRHYVRSGGRPDDGHPRGGANFSLPIVIGTAIDLLSDLYIGESQCADVTGAGTTEAARAGMFISRYFPGLSAELARLLWDGIRNGLTHDFRPKRFRYRGRCIDFRFSIDENGGDSRVEQDGEVVRVAVNVFELCDALTEAVAHYRRDLERSEDLQDKFIAVATAVEHQERDITHGGPYAREAEILRTRLATTDRLPLFE